MRVYVALALLAACMGHSYSRQLLAPDLAPSPLAGVRTGVLNLTDPQVQTWATIFQRYYARSIVLTERYGTNRTAAFENTFLLANAALSAAAARNIQAALYSVPTNPGTIDMAVSYSQAAGSQAIRVARTPEAAQFGLANVTAYTEIAGAAAVTTASVARMGSLPTVATAANRTVQAAEVSLAAAIAAYSPAPSPFDRPY